MTGWDQQFVDTSARGHNGEEAQRDGDQSLEPEVAEAVQPDIVADEPNEPSAAPDQPLVEAMLAPDQATADEPLVEPDEPLVEATLAPDEEGAGELVEAEGDSATANEAVEPTELDDPARLRSAVEAILLVVDAPTDPMMIAQVLDRPVAEIETALGSLRDEYDAGGRGIELRQVAQGWRLYTRPEFAGYIERFVLDGQQAKLTQASLETLAVVAYRQPVTRSRVSGIRGVNVDAVMRTLLSRGLIEEAGSDPETGGGLYRTTQLFLEKLGLRSLSELPSLAPLLPDTSQLDDVALSS